MARKKTAFERFFSLNWHRKRLGGAKHIQSVADFAAMKMALIDGDAPMQTRGSAKSLDAHLENLRREFAGQPELLWHHAKLIVLLRRGVETEKVLAQFEDLWEQEGAFLAGALNLRWLVSATDTFADHSRDAETRTLATLVSLLVNTIKIYETERVLADGAPLPLSPVKIERVQDELVPLFSGLSCFTVGTDDTLRNMRWRLDPLMEKGPVGLILKTVFDRLQVEDTAYARLKAQHHRERTGWWSE
ncbi:hypothetical protein GVN24_20595 [Rhizobium sp. CRIBSB]|nr:hypothetical protein [Rhizobium sp. CRIBSB]